MINPVRVVDMAVETIRDGHLHICRDAAIVLHAGVEEEVQGLVEAMQNTV